MFSTFLNWEVFFRNETIIKTRLEEKKKEEKAKKKTLKRSFYLNTQIYIFEKTRQIKEARRRKEKKRLKIHVLIKQHKINFFILRLMESRRVAVWKNKKIILLIKIKSLTWCYGRLRF